MIMSNENPKPLYSFKKQIKESFHGYHLSKNVKVGDQIRIFRNFVVTDFDPYFKRIYNDIQNFFLKQWLIDQKISGKNIHNFLIFLNNDMAEVFINIPYSKSGGSIQLSKKEDHLLTESDFLFLQQIQILGINSPFTDRLIYFFEEGDHHGLYISLTDSHSDNPKKYYETVFSFYHSHLEFLIRLNDDATFRKTVFSKGWFPFYQIFGIYSYGLYVAIREGWGIDSIENEIINSIKPNDLNEMKNEWLTDERFNKNKVFLDNAIELYLKSDFFSCIHILYPRIEGMLRFMYSGEEKKPNTDILMSELKKIGTLDRLDTFMLLPNLFQEYLKTFYFMDFDVSGNRLDLSRQSFAHGVAKDSDFTQKRAFQAIMMLDQIYRYISFNNVLGKKSIDK